MRKMATSAILFALLSFVIAVAAVEAANVTLTVQGGVLSLVTFDFQGGDVTLTGMSQNVALTPATAWRVIDARGTGAQWAVTMTATDLVSAAAGTDPARVIPASSIGIAPGTVTKHPEALDSDDTVGITAGGGQFGGVDPVTLLSATSNHKGTYNFSPTLSIAVPSNTYKSNTGNPYTTTLTVTIQ